MREDGLILVRKVTDYFSHPNCGEATSPLFTPVKFLLFSKLNVKTGSYDQHFEGLRMLYL